LLIIFRGILQGIFNRAKGNQNLSRGISNDGIQAKIRRIVGDIFCGSAKIRKLQSRLKIANG